MGLKTIFKNRKTRLRVFGAGEPGTHQQLTWLVLLIRELKAEVKQLREENERLAFHANSGAPLAVDQWELIQLRHEVNELQRANKAMTHKFGCVLEDRKALRVELYERTKAA